MTPSPLLELVALTKSNRVRICLGLIVLNFGIDNTSLHAQSVWTQTSTGSQSWATGSNWEPSVAPSAPGIHVIFNNTPTGNQTISTGASFRSLGRLDIGVATGVRTYTVFAAGGGGLNFTAFEGGNAQLNHLATGNADTISAPISLSASLDITNASASALTLSTGGISSATGGLKTLTTSTGLIVVSGGIGDGSGSVGVVQDGPGTLQLAGDNTFTGGLTLNGGTINVNSNTAFGGAGNIVTINGGTLNSNTSARSMANAYDYRWNADFAITGSRINFGSGNILLGTDVRLTTGALIHTVGGVIDDGGAGYGFTLSGTGSTLNLNNANTYSGATMVEGGRITLGGLGSILNSTDLVVREGTLYLDNLSAVTQRLSSTADLTLAGGAFAISRSATTAYTQSLGKITLESGNNMILLEAGSSGKKITVQAESLTRANRAVGFIQGKAIGGAGADDSSVQFAEAPEGLVGGGGGAGTKTVSIIPWLVGESNVNNGTPGTDFYTYAYNSGTGKYELRPLASAEYHSASGVSPLLDLSAVDPATNASVRMSGAFTSAQIIGGTVNSLQLMENSLSSGVLSNAIYNLSGTVTIGSGALLFSKSGGTAYTAELNGGTVQFGGAEGIITATLTEAVLLNSRISGSNGVTLSTYNAGSSLTLNSSLNDYTGQTTVNGAVIVGVDGGIPAASNVVIAAGGSLTLKDVTSTIGSLGGAGKVNLTTATGGTLIAGGDNTSTTYEGIIGGANGNLAKNGTGVLTLTGANVYTGTTTVNAGTLIVGVDGIGSLTSSVTVTSGTLGGSGSTTGNVTIGNGAGGDDAVIAAGNGLGAFTTTGELSLLSDATYKFELNSSTLEADKLVANGVTLEAGSKFVFTDLGTGVLDIGTIFTLIDNTSSSAITGAFSNLAEGAIFVYGANAFQASYLGGTGNDVILTVTAVPEPSTWALLACAFLALQQWRARLTIVKTQTGTARISHS